MNVLLMINSGRAAESKAEQLRAAVTPIREGLLSTTLLTAIWVIAWLVLAVVIEEVSPIWRVILLSAYVGTFLWLYANTKKNPIGPTSERPRGLNRSTWYAFNGLGVSALLIAAVVLLVPWMWLFMSGACRVHQSYAQQWVPNQSAMPSDAIGLLGATLVVMQLLPNALVEEFAYRGWLLKSYSSHLGTIPAIVITSTMFGISHYESSSISNHIAFGFILATVAIATRSLRLPVMMHIGSNLLLVLLFKYPLGKSFKTVLGSQWASCTSSGSLVLLGLIVIGALLAWRRRIDRGVRRDIAPMELAG